MAPRRNGIILLMEKKTQQFKAEIAEMLDLVVNSLYSKKEIFLRELISNASDAIDRAKFLSLTDKALVQDNPEWKIQIAADKGAKTLMISDNGIGMDAAELEQNLGTIASSGTKKFREMLKEKGGESLPELIGQFGVGFYAAFMVADKVTVETMKRGTEVSCKWESDMSGGYTISDGERDFPGTSITLHLRDDQLEYLDWWRVSDLVKKYSDGQFVSRVTATDKAIVTLYAIWEVAPVYKVRFDSNGGSGLMSIQQHVYGESTALTKNAFKRTGYTFMGWSTDKKATTATYRDEQPVKNLTSTNGETIVLYAIWSQNKYSIVYYPNNGKSPTTVAMTGGKDFNQALMALKGIDAVGNVLHCRTDT